MRDQGASTPDGRTVRRALWIAVAWSYVAALAAALLVGLTALVALIVELVAFLSDSSNRSFEAADAWSVAAIVAWAAIPIALVVSVWVAAYGSTRRDSLRGSVGAVVAAAAVAAALWFGSSTAIIVVGLSAGWSIALPAEHPARWLLRLVPAGVAVLAYPRWDEAAAWLVVVALMSGPVVGGLAVAAGDLVWTAIARLRRRGTGETLRSPTSLDV